MYSTAKIIHIGFDLVMLSKRVLARALTSLETNISKYTRGA